MSDLFEEDKEDALDDEGMEDFEEVEVDTELTEPPASELDARRKLENLLEEKRLRDELDDFGDF